MVVQHNPYRTQNLSVAEAALRQLLLDHTKIEWHLERVRAWERGERIAPILVDMALTRACNIACQFCYATLEEGERRPILRPTIDRFLDDCAEIGVRAISLVGDGESTLSPIYEYTIRRGHQLGISMAQGTHGQRVTGAVAKRILPSLEYLRFNFEAGNAESYARIMGCKPEMFHVATKNLRDIMEIKRRNDYKCTVGMQMVLMPSYGHEVLSLARHALDIGVDYLQIKHCADDEFGSLGIDYKAYPQWYPVLQEAEAMSTEQTKIIVKWNKLAAGNVRSYARCYGAPFILELSGSGLVVPCGMLTNARYGKFHIGNIVDDSFKELVMGDRYWEVMSYLASPNFDARRMCGVLCLQHHTNVWLDEVKKGSRQIPDESPVPIPQHVNFI